MVDVSICMGSSCFSRGNRENLKAILDYVKVNGLESECVVSLSGVLCMGCCSEGPNITIDGNVYNVSDTASAIELLKGCLK